MTRLISLAFLAVVSMLVNAIPLRERPQSGAIKRTFIESRASPKFNVGYFGNWLIYGRNFQPSDINPSQLTHVIYGFALISATTGEISLSDTYADQQKHYDSDSWSDTGNNLYGCFKQFYLLKQANRNLKVLLSVGGWTYSQENQFAFVTDASARATFVSSAVKLLDDNGLDGIDIDFEYPTAGAQATAFASLLSELRTALDSYASSKGDKVPYQISVAVPAGAQNYVALQVKDMDQSVDIWNLMAYDYQGSWSNSSGNQANLFPDGLETPPVNTDDAVKWYLANGVTAAKMAMGIPVYGRAFEMTEGLGKSFTGIGPGTWGPGVYDYKALPFAGATVHENSTSGSSFSYDPVSKELVSYDTPNIAKQKAQYVISKDLGGAMYWDLSSDKTGADSLIGTVASTFGTLDQTQNHLNYPGSQFDNIKNCMGTCGGSSSNGTTPSGSASTSSSTSTTQTHTPSTPSPLPTNTTTTTTTTSTMTTMQATATSGSSGSTGGSCNGIAAWTAGMAYVGGTQVTYNGHLWTAKYWSEGDAPGDSTSDWTDDGAC